MQVILWNVKSRVVHVVWAVCVVVLAGGVLLAQSNSYRIQTEDRLNISFWEHPELNTQTTVNGEGEIELPIIGRVRAAGATIDELRQRIIAKMSTYNRLVNQLSIKVEEYGQNRVYVTGQVANPGRYSFEEIPNIWDIILEAGGPLDTALLDKVTVIRGDGDGQVFAINLAAALREGKLNELPKIRPRDTINIVGTSESGIIPSPLSVHEEIYVLGAVENPGAHQFEPNLNLLEALGRAGGPAEDANLQKARYVVIENGKTRVVPINLNDYLVDDKFTAVPIMRKGSTLYIPPKGKVSPLTIAAVSALLTGGIAVLFLVLDDSGS